MSEALEISKSHTSFSENQPARVIDDILKDTAQTIKTKYRYFKKQRSITHSTSALGAETLYEIQRDYGFVSDFWLEIKSDNSAAWDIGVGGACNAINRVRVEIGSEVMMEYSGDDLYKMIHLMNKDEDTKTEIVSLMKSGDPNADPLTVPLLVPGSNLCLEADPVDSRNPVFPIKACSQHMTIRITLQTGAFISKTNAFVLGSMTLKFKSYKIDNDPVEALRTTGLKSSTNIFYSWNFLRPVGTTYTRTLTDATADSFTIDNVITDGELNCIVIDVLDRTTKVADMEYQDTQIINVLELLVRGTEKLYEHSTAETGRILCRQEFKITNKYNSSASGYGYFYPMALTGRPDLSMKNFGTKGLNLFLNKPTINLTCTSLTNSASAHTVRVLGVYKCMYQIRSNGDVKSRFRI
jgi:hypothetical protein